MSDVYRIGMQIVLAGNAVHGLQQIATLLGGIHGHVGRIHAGFRGWAAVLGVGAVGAGVGIIGGLKTALDHAKELSRELAITQSFNLGPGEAFRVNQEARRIGSGGVTGVTQSGAQRIFNQIYPLAGVDHGIEAMDSLSRASKLLGFITHDREGAGKSLLEVVKSAELGGRFSDPNTGHFDKQKFDEFLSLIVKWSDATHGVVGPKQIYQLFQQGAPALKNMSLEGMGSMFGAVLDMGGHRAGTALSSVFTQFFGDVMTKDKAEELQKLGILKKYTTEGGHVHVQEWNESFRNVLRKDPLMAGQKLFEAMNMSPEKAQEELFKVFSRVTSGRLFSDLMANFLQKIQERARVSGVQDMRSMEKNIDNNDVETAEINLKNAYKSLWESISGPMATTGILNLNSLTHALEDLTKYVNTIDPEKLRDIFNSIKVLGLSLVGAGGIALLAALGPAGWMVLGVGAMTATFIAFRKEIIESEFAKKLGEEFALISKGLSIFFGFLQGMWEKFKNWMVGHGLWGKGDGPTDPRFGGLPAFDGAYHPGGGANDNYSWSDIGMGHSGGSGVGAGSGRGRGASVRDAAGRLMPHIQNLGAVGGGNLTALIAEVSRKHGIDSRIMEGIRAGESGHGSHYDIGDLNNGPAYGPFQLNVGRGRLGDKFQRATGLSLRDPSTIAAQADWVAGYIAMRKRQNPNYNPGREWFGFHGLRNANPRWGDSGYSPRSRKAITEGVTPPPRKQSEPVIQFDAHLDGEVLSRSTTRRQSKMAMFPTSSGDIDPHGRYHDAGTRFSDVG
jgi:hypothetical protein